MLAALRRAPTALAAPLRLSLPSLAVRALRTSAPVQSTSPTVTTSSGAVVPVDKYFDDESLMAHQARVRHADPGNRTFNYTMVGGSRFLGAPARREIPRCAQSCRRRYGAGLARGRRVFAGAG